MKNNKELKIGSILSYVQMGIHIISGIVYTPLMIRLLGQSDYGLYNTVASTISMISILNLGFSSGYIRFFSKYKSNNDEEAIKKLNGMYLTIFGIIGTIAFLCGLFLANNLKLVFDNGLTTNELHTAKILMLIMSTSLAASFFVCVFQCVITANEKFVVLKVVAILKSVLTPILTIPLLFMGFGSIGLVSVTVVFSLITDVTYVFFAIKKLNFKVTFGHYEKGAFKELFQFTFFIALNIITDQINWNIDKYILGRYCGTIIVAVYSIGSVIQTYYQMFSSAVSNVFTPRIHMIVNKKDICASEKNSQITELFIKVGRIQFIILSLILSGFIFFGKEFIRLWAGKGYEQSYSVAILLMAPVTILLIQNLGNEIQRAYNMHKYSNIIYAGMAVINLILTIYLSPKYGAIGAAFGTALSFVLANGLVMNILYYYLFHIDIKKFWKNIARMSVGLIIPAIVGVLIKHFFDLQSVIYLVIFICIYGIAYCLSMYFLGINQFEKDLFVEPILKVLKKIKK